MSEIQLRWEFSRKQTEIFESDSRFTVAMCGRRFGKNEVASLMAIDHATQPDKRPFGADDSAVVWWVGPTYNQTLKYGFEKVLEKVPPRIIDGDPKRSAPFEIDFFNGSRIEFYSFDRPSSLQGAGVDFMIIDEAAYMPESVWQNDLRPMLLDNTGGALLISKPMGENWFATRHEWGRDASKPEWSSVHATSYDNPWVDDAEIDAAKRTTPEQVFRQEYLADPQSGGTLLTLDMLDTDPAEVLNGRDWQWHIAVDLGVEMKRSKARENDTDYWALAIVAEAPTEPLAYVAEVRRRRGQSPAQAASWIRESISGYPTNRVYFESVQAQAWFEEDLLDAGIDPIPVTPKGKKRDRILNLSVPFSNGAARLIDWSDVEFVDMQWSDFKTEWAGFPGDHDDQLDAVAMALDNVTFGRNILAEADDMYSR